MSKISADHLSRVAYVYVRQSTADQLTNNPESRRRQYGLATRAQPSTPQDLRAQTPSRQSSTPWSEAAKTAPKIGGNYAKSAP